MDLPFDGAITATSETGAPAAIRKAIQKAAGKDDILDPTYPYPQEMKRKEYDARMDALQIQLVRLQADGEIGGQASDRRLRRARRGRQGRHDRRDAREPEPARGAPWWRCPNPPTARRRSGISSAMSTGCPRRARSPCSTAAGTTAAWWNMSSASARPEREQVLCASCPIRGMMLVDEGIVLVKLWLNVGRAEQLRRFLAREADPLKQWKLSSIDVEGLSRWDAYSAAITETLARSHTRHAPWTVIRSDDKKRARIAAIQTVLARWIRARMRRCADRHARPRHLRRARAVDHGWVSGRQARLSPRQPAPGAGRGRPALIEEKGPAGLHPVRGRARRT
jgi:polyphosphate kinase